MANTTIDQLASITGVEAATGDLFLMFDASADIEKSITVAEMKSMIGEGSFTFNTSGTGDALVVTNINPSGSAAPDIVFYRNSGTPDVSDNIGTIIFRGNNSALVAKEYASINAAITNPTSSSEQGFITFNTMNAGVNAERVRIRYDGGVGIGLQGGSDRTLAIGKNITGSTTSYGIINNGAIQSDVTATAFINRSLPTVVNSAFTLPNIYHYAAAQGAIGALATVTSQTGFLVESSLIGAVTNVGFSHNGITAASVTTGKFVFAYNSNQAIATGGGTAFNLYMQGTAPNYLNGNVGIGAVPTVSKLHVSGNTYISGAMSGGSSILSSGAGGIGYATGAGGAVTQLTSRTTGVTLNKTSGAITMFTAAGSTTAATFTVTNSTVAATDVIILNQKSGTNLYNLEVTAVAAGSFNVTFFTTGGTASDAPVINFAVIKAVAA